MSKKIQNKNKYNKPDNNKEQSKKTPKWFYIVPVLLPLIFFILLELLLRLFNYGVEYKQWLDLTKEIRVMNPDYTRKYFHTTSAVPYPNGNFFFINKPQNSFRVFILGESSAAGYPFSPNGDFGKYIRKRLELDYPDKTIEVVNLGITAINTFTIRDLLPGVLEQKPDLLLIYTGHNEYYGALGVGSTESLGSNRGMINAALWLEKFRTTQLVRNMLKSFIGLFSNLEKTQSGTLMSRMAKDQYIAYNSDVFNKGLEQFEGNISDIIQMAKDNGVKVIISTLTSNLRDQYPFVSVNSDDAKNLKASDVYKNAVTTLTRDSVKADKLFRLAKDLDGLKFRAPERMNDLIKKIASKYNILLVNVDSAFATNSPFHITGNNLMTDHLHPSLWGYQLLGKCFYDVITRSGILSKTKSNNISEDQKDSIVKANFNFSGLDSIIARYRIIILKNDWPFRNSSASIEELLSLMKPLTPFDTIALKVTYKEMDWEEAHRLAAAEYLRINDFKNYTEEILVLADQFPFVNNYYSAAEVLLEKQQFDLAYKILVKKDRIYPDDFSSKWIGIIELSKNNSNAAVKYLNKSIGYNNKDAQVFFNLAGAYSLEKKFPSALESINNCLKLNPSFPGAIDLKNQLTAIIK